MTLQDCHPVADDMTASFPASEQAGLNVSNPTDWEHNTLNPNLSLHQQRRHDVLASIKDEQFEDAVVQLPFKLNANGQRMYDGIHLFIFTLMYLRRLSSERSCSMEDAYWSTITMKLKRLHSRVRHGIGMPEVLAI